MFLNGLRIFYISIPVLLFLWSFSANQSFQSTVHYINTFQGPKGVLVINRKADETIGKKLTAFFDSTFPTTDNDWKVFFKRTGTDLDRVIRFTEQYWLWGILGGLFLAGLVILFLAKDYSMH